MALEARRRNPIAPVPHNRGLNAPRLVPFIPSQTPLRVPRNRADRIGLNRFATPAALQQLPAGWEIIIDHERYYFHNPELHIVTNTDLSEEHVRRLTAAYDHLTREVLDWHGIELPHDHVEIFLDFNGRGEAVYCLFNIFPQSRNAFWLQPQFNLPDERFNELRIVAEFWEFLLQFPSHRLVNSADLRDLAGQLMLMRSSIEWGCVPLSARECDEYWEQFSPYCARLESDEDANMQTPLAVRQAATLLFAKVHREIVLGQLRNGAAPRFGIRPPNWNSVISYVPKVLYTVYVPMWRRALSLTKHAGTELQDPFKTFSLLLIFVYSRLLKLGVISFDQYTAGGSMAFALIVSLYLTRNKRPGRFLGRHFLRRFDVSTSITVAETCLVTIDRYSCCFPDWQSIGFWRST